MQALHALITPLHDITKNENKWRIIWKKTKKCLSLQRERRNQVEPRCAERWHLRDDEQFDLAAWFPSLKYTAGHVWPALFISWCIASRWTLSCLSYGCSDKVDQLHDLTTHFHLIVRMNDKLRQAISIDEALAIVVEIHLETIFGKTYPLFCLGLIPIVIYLSLTLQRYE